MENLENQIGWILQEKYGGKMTAGAKKDIVRLKKGEPLDYIIGFTSFLGCKILVNKKVLIPRVETEFWVEQAIEEITGYGLRITGYKILDVFAGSGCIGISIVRHIKGAHVTFADLQKDTLSQIKKNIKVNKIDKTQYKIIQSDIFSNIKGVYDYIFANPPYIPLRQKKKIQTSVIKYEPKAALFGGEDGMFFIRKFLAEAKNFLTPDGKIFMEFDSPQKLKIEKLLKKYGYQNWEFHKDQYKKWRWVSVSV